MKYLASIIGVLALVLLAGAGCVNPTSTDSANTNMMEEPSETMNDDAMMDDGDAMMDDSDAMMDDGDVK